MKNIYYLLHEDLYENARRRQNDLDKTKRNSQLFTKLAAYTVSGKMDHYEHEMEYIFKYGINVFPYSTSKQLGNILFQEGYGEGVEITLVN